ncbi:hypothetical protein [Bacillus sp. RC252]|uniref:hypothetical protein n=1 Tax=Bacillus sp. RC252 TaxID=3156289 RepID=UPI0038356A05
MKAKKLIYLAFPLILVAGVGCSKDNAEEKKTDNVKVEDYKKTDNLKDAESKDKKESETVKLREEDFMKTVDEELDKALKETESEMKDKDKKVKEEVKEETKKVASEEEKANRTLAEERASDDKSNKVEEPNKEVVKEAVIGGGRTLAEERAYIDKKLNNESRHYSPLEQYQEEVEETSNELVTAVKSSKSLLEKDKTMQTNKSELKGQLSVVSGRMDRLASIEPPKDYDYFKVQLRDDAKIIKQVVDQAFIAFNENDTEKAQANLDAMMEYLDTMALTLNEIKDAQN